MTTKDALEKLSKSKANARGLTMREIAKELGLSLNVARDKVSDAVAHGLCRCVGKRVVTRMDGQQGFSPVYRFGRKS